MDLKICIIGKGNVGTSFLQLLKERQDVLKSKYNINPKIIAVFEHDGGLIKEGGINIEELIVAGEKFRDLPYWKKSANVKDYLSKLNLNLCIEATPTNHKTGEPALSYIIEALNAKIDVVTSNKAPFYLEYKKIKDTAEENKCYVQHEATVASCVPALSIKENLIGNKITSIKAILNGTSNFILSRMTAEGISFSLALKEAQELGYAETDPTLDIEGYDAAGKLVILANEFFNWLKNINDVKIKGISSITPHAIELAKSDGLIIKHLAIAEKNELIVEPRLIDKNSPLNISGTLNVIEFQTQYAGPIILKGRGAGGYEAASAILNDLIKIIKLRDYS
ncbi:MAG: homoserine dehydrogenase [Candidatus Hodarchaeota archaeon]